MHYVRRLFLLSFFAFKVHMGILSQMKPLCLPDFMPYFKSHMRMIFSAFQDQKEPGVTMNAFK